MMFRIKRNQAVIAALAVMIGVAGWLSFIDRRNRESVADLDFGMPTLNEAGEVTALIADLGDTGFEFIGAFGSDLVTDDDITILTSLTQNADFIDATDFANLGEAVFVSATDISNFFAQEKLDREQGRARQRELLMEMINSQHVDRETKSVAADKLLEIHSRIENETAAEALLAAKGFGQTYVRIDDSTVDVIISKSGLSDAEIAQIEDIVKRKTGMGVESIRISTVKR
jgi:stage III sporulation protein AH